MTSLQTLWTPEVQWDRTVRYVNLLYQRRYTHLLRRFRERGPRDGKTFSADELAILQKWQDELAMIVARGGPRLDASSLWVVRVPHRLFSIGDVFVVTIGNGMCERYAMSGVSSKGARLNDYYLSMRPDYKTYQLPDDLIDSRWDDPAIGRFVADLRASSRRRVGASIPAPMQMPLSGVRTQGLRFDGYYGAGRVPRPEQARHRRRFYLRFFPDGTVIRGYFPYPRTPVNPESFREGPWGEVLNYSLRDGGALSFSVVRNGEVKVRYEGQTLDGRLRLTRYMSEVSSPRDLPREHIFRFFQWPK